MTKILQIAVAITTVIVCSAYGVLPEPDGGYENYNTAEGQDALFNLDTLQASYNVAIGVDALYWAVDCEANTAIGSFALINNSTGSFNTAIGDDSLFHNSTGSFCVAVGLGSLYNETTGSNNIAVGNFAGSQLTTESYNVDIGNVGVIGDQGVIRIGQAGNQVKTWIAGIYNNVIANNARTVVIRQNGQLGIAAIGREDLEARIEQLEKQVLALQSKVN